MNSPSTEQLESKEPQAPVPKWWRINRKLILLKGHFFFFFGSLAAIIPPLILYSQQLGLSLSMVGTLFAALPFIQCVAKAVGGAVADKFQIHKGVFIFGIVVMAISTFSMNFIPSVPTSTDQRISLFESSMATLKCDASSKNINIQLDICQQHTTTLPDPRDNANEIINPKWPLQVLHCDLSCGSSSDPDTVAKLRILFCGDELLDRDLNLCSKVDQNGNSNDTHSFFNIKEANPTNLVTELDELKNETFVGIGDEIGNCVTFGVRSVTLLDSGKPNATNITVQTCPLRPHDTVSLTCTAKCFSPSTNVGNNATNSADQQAPITSPVMQVTWLWLGCIITWSMYGVVLSIADAILVSTLGDNQNDFGKTRLFASVGWGLISPIAAYLIEFASDGLDIKDYRPGFYMFLALVLCDIAIAVPMKVTVGAVRPKHLVKEVMATFRRLHVFMFVAAVFFEGVATGVLWTFGIVYANELNSNPVVMGLTYFVECFLSEIPLFWVSGWIVGKLGHATSLSCALLVTGIKSVLYSLIPDAWYMLPIGLVHGVTYGLLYSTMSTYANKVAPPGACATLQGIFQGVFEGVGVGVGNFVGGVTYDYFGGRMTFRIFGLWIIGVAAVYQLFTYVSSRRKSSKQSLDSLGT